MYFGDLHSLLYMDGHGPFVWAAYGITLLALLQMLLAPWRRRRKLLAEIAGELRRERSAPSTGGKH